MRLVVWRSCPLFPACSNYRSAVTPSCQYLAPRSRPPALLLRDVADQSPFHSSLAAAASRRLLARPGFHVRLRLVPFPLLLSSFGPVHFLASFRPLKGNKKPTTTVARSGWRTCTPYWTKSAVILHDGRTRPTHDESTIDRGTRATADQGAENAVHLDVCASCVALVPELGT